MELTKQAILNNKEKTPGLEGYNVVVNKIEKNITIHPDIAIESCKSLIEGLCKKALVLLSDKYNSDRGVRKQCDNKLEYLVQTAFNEVFKNEFELELFSSLFMLIRNYNLKEGLKIKVQKIIERNSLEMLGNLGKAVVKISKIRDRRGDISHGRIYPKLEESEVYLAKSIVAITDGICSFMIEETALQYLVKVGKIGKFVYDDLEDFNNWINDNHQIHSIKVEFSKLLFKGAYQKYEDLYYSDYQEFLDSLKSEEELNKEGLIENSLLPEKLAPNSFVPIIDLVNNSFNKDNFWTEKRKNGLAAIALTNYFTVDGLGKLISEYLSDDRPPLRDDIRKIYRGQMNLREMRTALPMLEKKIVKWAQDIKAIEE